MKKALLIVLFVCSAILAASSCLEGFLPAVEMVEKTYIKAKINHERTFPTERYIYQVFPTVLFPYFCLPKDTAKKIQGYHTMHLCNCATTIGAYIDNMRIKHVQFVILQYVKSGIRSPWSKTYTMYFMKQDLHTKIWEEERKPIAVTFVVQEGKTYKYVSTK